MPILPVTVNGSRRVLPRGSLIVKPGKIQVRDRRPHRYQRLYYRYRSELIDKTRQAVMANFDPEYAGGLTLQIKKPGPLHSLSPSSTPHLTFCGQYFLDIQNRKFFILTLQYLIKKILTQFKERRHKHGRRKRIDKPVKLKADLAAFLGASSLPRTEITKKVVGLHQGKQTTNQNNQW